nr:MAG: 16S rRNA (guanine(966)-N(2))-methyltransferase RsmD [Pseudomonadota bacterium]
MGEMGEVRIIAGEARGRKLQVPPGLAIRPTRDRVRQSIFDILGQFFHGERVLDLYAGVGAMGFEALSRGAGQVTFVERERTAIRTIEANARKLGWSDRIRIVPADVESHLRGARRLDYELIFLDPPYELGPEPALRALGQAGLPEGAVVVAEHEADWSADESYGRLRRRDHRRYGTTGVTFFEARSEDAP